MKKLLMVLPLVLLLCLTFSCQQAEEVGVEADVGIEVDVEADVEEIKAWFDTYTSTAAAGDLDAWVDHFAEDIVAMPPNEATMKGKEALRQWGQPFFDQFNQEELVTIKEIEVSGNWAFARLPYTLKLTPKGGGETFQANGKGIFIFKRQADGTWKASHVIWNGNDPLPVLPEKE